MHAVNNSHFRYPAPGFHPQFYADEIANRYDRALANPFADFIGSVKSIPARSVANDGRQQKGEGASRRHFGLSFRCRDDPSHS